MLNMTHTYQTGPLLKRLYTQYIVRHKSKLTLAVICMILVAAATAARSPTNTRSPIPLLSERSNPSGLRIRRDTEIDVEL